MQVGGMILPGFVMGILLMVIVTYQQVVGRLRVIATVYMKLLVIELT
jgi:hypothetical protein